MKIYKIKQNILYKSLRPIIATGLVAISCASNFSQAAICEYSVTEEWVTGFLANITITNDTDRALNGWEISWEYTNDNRYESAWNATVTGDNPYTANNLASNANIQSSNSIEFGIQGTKSSNSNAEIPVITGDVCSSTPTPEETPTSTNGTGILDSWIMNTTGETSAIMDGGTTLVNVTNVEAVSDETGDYALVTAAGMPNYVVLMTSDLISWLDARPLAAADFDDGVTTAQEGVPYDFGADIGYSFAECEEGAGQGYWPPAGTGCTAGDATREGYFPLVPTPTTTETEAGALTVGYAVNGVSIYTWFDGMSYENAGVWTHLASVAELYDVDSCGGHPAPTTYHHHHYSDCWAEAAGEDFTGHSEVYGYIADGYPIYGPFQDNDVLAQSCWKKRDYDVGPTDEGYGCVGENGAVAGERTCLLVDQYDPSLGVESASSEGPRTDTTILSGSDNTFSSASGFYFQDYYYDSSCSEEGDERLDQYNGHTDDIRGYHYHLTLETAPVGDYVPIQATFPFTFGPRYAGEIGSQSILETGDDDTGGDDTGGGGDDMAPPDGMAP